MYVSELKWWENIQYSSICLGGIPGMDNNNYSDARADPGSGERGAGCFTLNKIHGPFQRFFQFKISKNFCK
jgi:hypothetical protein